MSAINGRNAALLPRQSKTPKLRKFIVLEVVSTVEAESEEAARDRLPKGRTFVIQEVGK